MMRFQEIVEARAWRKYVGHCRDSTIANLERSSSEVVLVRYGRVETGKARVFAGMFVQTIRRSGEEYLAEHPHSLRRALLAVEEKLEHDGWTLDAIGISADWYETGLSSNSGYGYHPSVNGACHMLDPKLGLESESK